MNKKKWLIIISIIVVLLLLGIFGILAVQKALNLLASKMMEGVLGKYRQDLTYGMSEQAKKDYMFYNGLVRYDYRRVYEEEIKRSLEDGADPDYCKGECGWTDHNPLMILTDLVHFTYDINWDDNDNNDNKDFTEEMDYMTIKLLYEYGADFNKYPYVWERIVPWTEEDYLSFCKNKPLDISEEEKRKATYIGDLNRGMRALLECGADPNYKGHPYPFTYEAIIRERMTGEQAIEYFNSPEATTPLYEAIKKGMFWESQVDLLLEYGATLDESCLEAARLSGDKAMIEKVERLMNGAI